MRRMARTTTALATAGLVLAACGGDDGGSGSGSEGGGPLVVWTLENLPDRLAAQQELAAAFSAESGVQVELVGVDGAQFTQLITSAAASDELPDVVGAMPLAAVQNLAVNELLDTDTAATVVEALGEDTFAEQALALTRDGDTQLAVPSDGFAQLLLYRRDLFEAAGLAEPSSYEAIRAAAEALAPQLPGYVGSTIPGDEFTEQTFEHFALANGCQLTDDAGDPSLDSPECVATFSFYDDLIRNYSVPGAQDADTTRAGYFAGEAAMVTWSSFILDELAGLREDAKPSCPECVADPRFLVDNTGIVTGIEGPDGDGAAEFGEVVSWAVVADADADPASRFVQHMMSTAYTDWLGFAPEGKFPARAGTAESPTEYVDAWRTLPAGVDTKAPLADYYPQELLDELAGTLDGLQRWGLPGQGALVGAARGELPVAEQVAEMTGGGIGPEDAARAADEAVTRIKDDLE